MNKVFEEVTGNERAAYDNLYSEDAYRADTDWGVVIVNFEDVFAYAIDGYGVEHRWHGTFRSAALAEVVAEAVRTAGQEQIADYIRPGS